MRTKVKSSFRCNSIVYNFPLFLVLQFDVPNAQKLLTDAINAKSSVQDIAFSFFALKNLGMTVDEKSVSAGLLEALKSDDSPTR